MTHIFDTKNFKIEQHNQHKEKYADFIEKKKYVDLCGNEVTAGGILFYNENKDFLMIYNEKRFRCEDFGGSINNNDKCIYDTIRRELFEESNGVFDEYLTSNEINDMIQNADQLYNKDNKYFLLISKLPSKMEDISLDMFGTKENQNESVKRTLKWILFKDMLNNKMLNKKILFHRLIFDGFLSYLQSLEKHDI
jgi:hypothetical protein